MNVEAQLLGEHNTDRCATLTMRAPDRATAQGWAELAGEALGMLVATVYEIEPPRAEHANRAVRP